MKCMVTVVPCAPCQTRPPTWFSLESPVNAHPSPARSASMVTASSRKSAHIYTHTEWFTVYTVYDACVFIHCLWYVSLPTVYDACVFIHCLWYVCLWYRLEGLIFLPPNTLLWNVFHLGFSKVVTQFSRLCCNKLLLPFPEPFLLLFEFMSVL